MTTLPWAVYPSSGSMSVTTIFFPVESSQTMATWNSPAGRPVSKEQFASGRGAGWAPWRQAAGAKQGSPGALPLSGSEGSRTKTCVSSVKSGSKAASISGLLQTPPTQVSPSVQGKS